MSQVISIRVPSRYDEACAEFQKEAGVEVKEGLNKSGNHVYMVSYLKSSHEIECQGDYPDSVFNAMLKVKESFGGKLFYEGEEWNIEEKLEPVTKAGTIEKIWVVLCVLFFPITIAYLLFRLFIWIPYKVWRLTR